jgi:hypothetical protein
MGDQKYGVALSGTCRTTDGTTWVTLLTIPVPADTHITAEVTYVAVDEADATKARYVRGKYSYFNDGATVQSALAWPDTPAFDSLGATPVVQNVPGASQMLFQVRGEAAKNIRWAGWYKTLSLEQALV